MLQSRSMHYKISWVRPMNFFQGVLFLDQSNRRRVRKSWFFKNVRDEKSIFKEIFKVKNYRQNIAL